MEISGNDVIAAYKEALAEANHNILVMSLQTKKLEEDNQRLKDALAAPVEADPVPLGPRVPVASPGAAPTS